MSRQILTSRERGYISQNNGKCYIVYYNPNGTHHQTNLLSNTCSQQRLLWGASQLGPLVAPSHRNGFEVMRGMNECTEQPGQMVVRVRNGGNRYAVTEDVAMENHYLFNEIGEDVETYCGPAPIISDPPNPDSEPDYPFNYGSKNGLSTNEIIALIAAIVLVLGLIIFAFKKR